ncbi:MAG: lipid A biosynthesis acyltransferase [Pseudopedobacter saltans]|uniref:Lipid A biosynthesis acyltransferase n=1 Tax=Pseudopedobacter saltans TaxID=151895 RepID=A0A2W5F2U1_9SPHI|nr:MAG: lipid A biosynthesis acyltransferase [Pseudopedobacter saltans]
MYYIVYGILYLFSLLPFPILYLLSDFVAFILRKITHYRKEVLRKNLLIAFPEKTHEEREVIRKSFYRNLTDNFVEAIKLLSISEKSLNKRFLAENPEVMLELYKQNKNITVVLGHFFNWEYANQLYSLKVQQDLVVVYMPLKNELFNRIFLKLRNRYKTFLVSAHKYATEIKPFGKTKPYTVILVGDQNPGHVPVAYWTPFFGVMTPFVTGPEKSARVGKHAVAYCSIKKVKRGHYTSRIELITENAFETPKGYVTKQMVSHIEKNIREQPENYLWSHNRFRHKYRDEFAKQVI